MADIFISYSHEDVELVSPYVILLEDSHFSVFWDPKLRAGDVWRQRLVEEHESSACVIVIWTENSIKSHWVFDEASSALKGNKIIPILLGDRAKIPPGFSGIQHLDFTTNGTSTEVQATLFVEAVRNKINQSPTRGDEAIEGKPLGSLEIRSALSKNSFVKALKKRHKSS